MAKSKQEDPGYNYLRLKALDAHQLPPHPELDNGANGPDLKSFIHNLLQDRREISATGTYTAKEPKDFGEQYPQVRLFTKKAGKEHWAFRTSLSRPDHHAKASFREFEYALKQNHSKHEKEFTDSIFDCNKLLVWNDAELEKAVDGLPFTNLTMEVTEMYHALPRPFNDRIFTVLVLTARQIGKEQFFIIQIPVKPGLSLATNKSHFITRGGISRYRNDNDAADEEQKKRRGNRLVHGMYCSVERVTEIEHVPYYRIQPGDSKPVRWCMATASHAKGLIPLFIQKRKVPGKIAHDVPYFLDWVAENRGWGAE